jgi:uncharacterized protein (TIGR03067 family)
MDPYLFVVVTVCLMAAAVNASANGATTRPADGDASKLQGAWTCVSAVVDGKPLPEKVAAQLKLVLTAERYRTEREGEVLFDSTYRLDAEQDPKWIEMVGTEGDAAGKPALGIYRVDGDTLKICYTMPGGKRPKDFESVAGSGAYCVTWKRAGK